MACIYVCQKNYCLSTPRWTTKYFTVKSKFSKQAHQPSARRHCCKHLNTTTKLDVNLARWKLFTVVKGKSGSSFKLLLSTTLVCECNSVGQDFSCHLLLFELVDRSLNLPGFTMAIHNFFGCAKSRFTQNNIFANRGRWAKKKSLELGVRPSNETTTKLLLYRDALLLIKTSH